MKYTQQIFNETEKIYILKSKGNDGIVEHSHEFIEIVYVSSGKGLHNVNNHTNMVSAGDIFLISPEDIHSLAPFPDSTMSFEWINCMFLPEFVNFDFSIFSPESRYIETDGLEMSSIFNAMLSEFTRKHEGYLEILRGYVTILLAKLKRIVESRHFEEENYIQRRRRSILRKSINYIESNYTHPIKLEDIAEKTGVSRSYLIKLFNSYKSTTPLFYINRYRVEQSCRLLMGTDIQIYRIGEMVGFGDSKIFYKTFEKINGMTPGEFRSRHGEGESLMRGEKND